MWFNTKFLKQNKTAPLEQKKMSIKQGSMLYCDFIMILAESKIQNLDIHMEQKTFTSPSVFNM